MSRCRMRERCSHRPQGKTPSGLREHTYLPVIDVDVLRMPRYVVVHD